jgi:hypothetical protein
MVRTQVQLTREQAAFLKQTAAAEGVSMAQVMRTCVDEQRNRAGEPGREEVRRRALAAIGAVRGGPPDLALRHDDYLVEAIEARWRSHE